MKNKNNICPVCGKYPIYPPHEVCLDCYQKTKNNSGLDEALKETEERAKEGVTLHHYLIDNWHNIDMNGLGAVQLIGEYILDNIEDDEKHLWHKRRIRFMQDMVQELDMKYFVPATKQQINDFAQSAVDFWDGKITIQEARERLLSMRKIVQKDIMKSSDWESKDFLLWMMETEDVFDWMWSQWFECIHACIPDKCNDELWIRMFHKHFHHEIEAWVNEK